MRRHFGWLSLSLKSPIYANHFFKPSLLDKTFTSWQNTGIKSFKDLYSDGVFSSFEQLCFKFSLPKSNFFRYLQARDFLRKTLTKFPVLPSCSPCDAFLERPPSFRGIISILYNKITLAHQSHLPHCKADWELDLGEDITEELWESILKRVHTSSVCARHGVIQCKILNRAHWTKQKLSNYFPDVDPLCNRCNLSPTTHAHMFWSCAKLKEFWSLIFKTITESLNKTIDPCPFLAIFGTSRDLHRLSKPEADCVAFATLLARRLILLKWKDAHPPSFTHWIRDLLHFLKLEKIKYSLRGSTKNFHQVWNPILNYIKEKVQLPAVP